MSIPDSADEMTIGNQARDMLESRNIVRDVLLATMSIAVSGVAVNNIQFFYNVFDYEPFATAIIYLAYTLGILSIVLLGIILFNVLLAVMLIVVESWEIA